MLSNITHFEIFGPDPAALTRFYAEIFGWRIEQIPGVDYWRIDTGTPQSDTPMHGGLTYRAIPNLNGWLLWVQVASVDDTVEAVVRLGGCVMRPKTAVPRTAWVTIVADPARNMFGVWQSDPNAFPAPEPD